MLRSGALMALCSERDQRPEPNGRGDGEENGEPGACVGVAGREAGAGVEHQMADAIGQVIGERGDDQIEHQPAQG